MASNNYNSFNKLNPSTNEWVVKVKALKVWEVLNLKENTPKTVNFILMDGNVTSFYKFQQLHKFYKLFSPTTSNKNISNFVVRPNALLNTKESLSRF